MTVKELKERLEGVLVDFRHFWGFGYRQARIRDAVEVEKMDGRRIFILSNAYLDAKGRAKNLLERSDSSC